MNFIRRINKPEYLYRATQLIPRMTQAVQPESDTAEVVLPSGLRMRVGPQEDRGRRCGV
jgi:hypothetical protein